MTPALAAGVPGTDDYEAFYHFYRGFVVHRLTEKHYPGDYQDGLQQTFLKFWRHKDHYHPGRSGDWLPILATIADRVASDETRRACNRYDKQAGFFQGDGREAEIPDPDYNPTRTALSRERTRLLKKLLVNLPPHERMALLARTINQVEPIDIWSGNSREARRHRANWRMYSYRAAKKLREAILADPITYGPLIPYTAEGDTTDDAPPIRVPDVPAGPAGWHYRLGGYDPARR